MPPAARATPGGADDDLAAPFRPRLARAVTLGIAVLVLVLTALLATTMPDLTLVDRTAFALFGLAIAWFCWRQASVRAVPDDTGLTVRNLLLTRHVTWAEIVSVRFGQGRAWVQLDLSDGDTLAVMGVQRADGTLAEGEARRLATLVAHRTPTPRDD